MYAIRITYVSTTPFYLLENIAKLQSILSLPDAEKLVYSSPQGWTTAAQRTVLYLGFLPGASGLLLDINERVALPPICRAVY